MLRITSVLLSILFAVSCASWQKTREEVVNPIHALLHHDYAHAIETLDPRELDALFAEREREAATVPTLELFAMFSRVEDARVAIDRVLLEEQPVRAQLEMVVEGEAPDGSPRTIRQNKDVTIARSDVGWRITSDAPGPMQVSPVPTAYYVDEAKLRGLWFRHETRMISDPHGEPQRYIYGSGVAAFDVNDDGWQDVVLLAGDRIELFVNEWGYFRNASQQWGVGESTERVLTIALPFDFDNDGNRDLFVGAEQGQSLLFRNTGERLERVENSGIVTTERTISGVAADFDGDGFVDLFLANHEDVYWNAPDLPKATNAQPDQLYLNNGDGTFRDVTEEAGVANRGWSLAPVAADYDLDGDVDLFVGNDFGLDSLYRNDGNARFEEVSSEAGVDLPIAAMGADWGDYDGDGDLDLFVSGMRSGSGWVLEVPEFHPGRVPRVFDMMFRPYVREAIRAWFRGNRLYENNGDGTFREFAAESGAVDSGWGWASVWLDFDNDGLLDVYNANGFITGNLEDDV